MISKYYPNALDIKKNELKTLSLIYKNIKITSLNSASIPGDVSSAIALLKSTNLNKITGSFNLLNFETSIPIEIKEKKYSLYFGGNISMKDKSTYDRHSYYLALYCIDSKKILRKFHFDYDCGADSSSKEQKPFFHIQYGGNLTPKMKREGITAEQEMLNSWMEHPRLYYFPMSLIFLIFIVLKEFKPQLAHEIFSEPEWKAHLMECEKSLLIPFLEGYKQSLNRKSYIWDWFYHPNVTVS